MNNIIVITALLLGLSSLAAAAADRDHPVSASMRSWKLAFVRANDIWVANGDGTDQKRIIENGRTPSWSPDKARIAFVRDNKIWVAGADGSEQRPVSASWKKRDPHDDGWFSDIGISWHPKNGSLTFSRPEVFTVERVDGTAGLVPTENASGGMISGSSSSTGAGSAGQGWRCAFGRCRWTARPDGSLSPMASTRHGSSRLSDRDAGTLDRCEVMARL